MPAPDTPLRLLLVEDDERFLEALDVVLSDRIELTVVGSVAGARASKGPFDAACVDLGLPDGDGVDVVRDLVSRFPQMPVIVLTVQRSDSRVLSAFRAGAAGYLLKEHTGARLIPAIEDARAGGAPMSPSVARRILRLVSSLPDTLVAQEPALTDREIQVLREFAQGLSYEQAAANLNISVNTLRTHVRSVYEKLAVGTRTEAVMSALQLGLLSRV